MQTVVILRYSTNIYKKCVHIVKHKCFKKTTYLPIFGLKRGLL